MLGLVGLSAYSLNRYAASGQDGGEASKLQRDRPSAARAGTRRLDMAMQPAPRVPALLPAPEVVEPIGVRRSDQAAPAGPKGLSPEDAPVLVVSSRPGAYPSGAGAPTQRQGVTRSSQVAGTTDEGFDPDDPMAATTRNLQGYQRQLQGLLDNLTQNSALATLPLPQTGQARCPPAASASNAAPEANQLSKSWP